MPKSLLKSAQETARGHRDKTHKDTEGGGERAQPCACGAGEQMGAEDASVNQREGNALGRGRRSAPATSAREDTTSRWDGDEGGGREAGQDNRMISEADRGTLCVSVRDGSRVSRDWGPRRPRCEKRK